MMAITEEKKKRKAGSTAITKSTVRYWAPCSTWEINNTNIMHGNGRAESTTEEQKNMYETNWIEEH